MADLFSDCETKLDQPLAAKLRPTTLQNYIGQQHILGSGKPLSTAILQGKLHSMVFWGPPGVGKTSLARLISQHCNAHFMSMSAVLGGVKEIRACIDEAKQQRSMGRKSVLFVDEVHRFNKAQQDAFLPYVEDGTVVFIGATTENPSFEINSALNSRSKIYKLRRLSDEEIAKVLFQALETLSSEGSEIKISEAHVQRIAQAADGDARRSLNILELAIQISSLDQGIISIADTNLDEVLAGATRRFDKSGDLFYEQISALHKSVRGSSVDASLYWYVRMLDGGCDPLYIARRVVRMASEDIGNADPRGLALALDAWDVQQRLGSPEGELAIAQAIAYLAAAAKSNAIYKAFNLAKSFVESTPSYDVPLHLRNAPTQLMKKEGYGEEYRYAHDGENAYVSGENYFPEEIKNSHFYEPSDRGLEGKIAHKLAQLRALDNDSRWQRYPDNQSDESCTG